MAAAGGSWKGGRFVPQSADTLESRQATLAAFAEDVRSRPAVEHWNQLKVGDVIIASDGRAYQVNNKPTRTGVTVQLLGVRRRGTIRLEDFNFRSERYYRSSRSEVARIMNTARPVIHAAARASDARFRALNEGLRQLGQRLEAGDPEAVAYMQAQSRGRSY